MPYVSTKDMVSDSEALSTWMIRAFSAESRIQSALLQIERLKGIAASSGLSDGMILQCVEAILRGTADKSQPKPAEARPYQPEPEWDVNTLGNQP